MWRGEEASKRTRLVLVFPLDLEDVEEVCGRGVDLDDILVVLGHRVREVGDLELLGALFCKSARLANHPFARTRAS